ncbi:uncharacterized protein [Porites lutea]|uniref:uncharacterized protein n=1 Tax=Porites lutea TaxID=51062 RepID=UPI003CC5AA49
MYYSRPLTPFLSKFKKSSSNVDECQTPGRCPYNCTNTPGSYTCNCPPCYDPDGANCVLSKCKINDICYQYNKVNPDNQCQCTDNVQRIIDDPHAVNTCPYSNRLAKCHSSHKTGWTNDDALSCNDGNQCTRNDRCFSGNYIGTSICLSPCEECRNDACHVKDGYCAIANTCFTDGSPRPVYSCQQCDSSNNKRLWTINDNLQCSDNDVTTKDDQCLSGVCKGTPYNCLECEQHDGAGGCPIKSGYCIIGTESQRKCYAKEDKELSNPCQWCDPEESTSTWSSIEGVACDDKDNCTKGDICSDGLCAGTRFTCNFPCQECNGNGCSLNTGYGFVSNRCTCKIAGHDYGHQTSNPSNQCQWCDLYDPTARDNSAWSNRPAVACDDQDTCTKQDTCNAGSIRGHIISSYEF